MNSTIDGDDEGEETRLVDSFGRHDRFTLLGDCYWCRSLAGPVGSAPWLSRWQWVVSAAGRSSGGASTGSKTRSGTVRRRGCSGRGLRPTSASSPSHTACSWWAWG